MKKNSFLSIFPLLLLPFLSRPEAPLKSRPNGYIGGSSPIYITRHGKLKGYMKEAHRTDRGHGYNKRRIHALR